MSTFLSSVDSEMEETYERLSVDLVENFRSSPEKQRWVGLAGGPGAGKSTLAHSVSVKINNMCGDNVAVVLPMDGFHYSRAQLRNIAAKSNGTVNFDDLIARRGAPWTFDAQSLCSAIVAAKQAGSGFFPIYSRQISDPVENGVELLSSHRIVLVEGNYLLNWEDPLWADLASVFDEKWFITCISSEQQRQRLIKRHMETWTDEKTRLFGPGEAGAAVKADSNDVLNALFVDSHRKFADKIIISL